MNPSSFQASSFAAGFGGVGPATPPPLPNTWAAVLVDVTPNQDLSGLELTGIELMNAAGEVVARAAPGPSDSLRRDADATLRSRTRWDVTDGGTIPFDGKAQAGKPLRLHARATLDTRLEVLYRAQPTRFRARVRAAGTPPVPVEGPLQGAWSTAGPAGPR